jgi:hypothetical protein
VFDEFIACENVNFQVFVVAINLVYVFDICLPFTFGDFYLSIGAIEPAGSRPNWTIFTASSNK